MWGREDGSVETLNEPPIGNEACPQTSSNPDAVEVAYEMPLYQRHVAQMPEVPEVPLYKVPPSVTAMSDADIDAAVRFCDDVLSAPSLILLPPTVDLPNLDPGWRAFFWKHRTVTFPVARIETASSPALFVKIEIPKIFKWDASIVTASGACVARWSQKANVFAPGTNAPLEWGGTHFGEVRVEPGGPPPIKKCFEPPVPPGIFAKGPTLDVVLAEDRYSKKYYLKNRAVGIACITCCSPVCLPCVLHDCIRADDEPYKALFRTSGGTEIGSYKIEKFRECCTQSYARGSLQDTEGIVHFGSMTAEQRRLALVTLMHGAAIAAHPPQGGGGGAGV